MSSVNFNVISKTQLYNSLCVEEVNLFTEMSEDKIAKEGLPDGIYQHLKNKCDERSVSILKNPSLAVSKLAGMLPLLNSSKFWKTPSKEYMSKCNTILIGFKALEVFESDFCNDEILFFQICQKIKSCIASKLVRDLKLPDRSFHIAHIEDPISQDLKVVRVLFKRKDEWFPDIHHFYESTGMRTISLVQKLTEPVIDSSGLKIKFLPHLGQGIILEHDLSVVSEKRINISFSFPERLIDDELIQQYVNVIKKCRDCFKEYGKYPNVDQDVMLPFRMRIAYYLGIPQCDTLQPNYVLIDLFINPINLELSRIPSVVSPQIRFSELTHLKYELINSLVLEAINIFEDDKEELVNAFINSHQKMFNFSICWPKNEQGWRKTLVDVIAEISKDPEKNADLIEYLFNELDPTITLKEFEEIASPVEVAEIEKNLIEATPQLMSQILLKDAMKEYKAGLIESLSPKESNNNNAPQTVNANAKQQDKPAKNLHLEKPSKVKGGKKEKKLAFPKETADPSISTFKMTPEEKTTVKSVMEGNPMRQKDFNKFFVKMLQRKMNASNLKSGKKGSHTKLHVEKTDGGSTGHTLVRSHGKKDTMGFIGSQKKSLKEFFNSFK